MIVRACSFIVVAACFVPRALAQSFEIDFGGPGSARFGEALGRIGDLDQDGFLEVFVGAPGFDNGLGTDVGALYIYSGASLIQALQPLSPPPQVLVTVTGENAGDEFGRTACMTVEDYDNDGHPDLLVGAPKHDCALGADCGAVYVVSGHWLQLVAQGQPAPPSGVLLVLEGPSTLGQYGFAVDGNGDGNADGLSDVAVGAPEHNAGSGRVEVVSGAWLRAVLTAQSPPAKVLWADSPGIGPNRKAGWDVAWAGDYDQDNDDDLVVGTPFDSAGQNNGGTGRVFSGGSFNQIIQLLAAHQIGYTAISVAGPGDMDGNGVPEILMGSPWDTPSSSPCGSCCNFSGLVHVFHGPILWPPANWNAPYSVQTPGDASACHSSHLGNSVSGCGDFNGDGFNDAVLGQIDANENGLGSGVVAIVRDVTPQSNQLIVKFTGTGSGQHFGAKVAAAGDVNSDGYADVLAWASGSDVVRFILGRDDSCNGLPTVDCNGNGRDDMCDIEMGLSQDVNGNLIPDECECYGTTYCTAKVNSQGCIPSIGSSGSATASAPDDFVVTASNVLDNKTGIVIWSTTAAVIPFGGGVLCEQPPLRRMPSSNSGGTPPCAGMYSQPVTDAYMASHGLVPGVTAYFQVWSRDPGFLPPLNVGLTNGLRVLICP